MILVFIVGQFRQRGYLQNMDIDIKLMYPSGKGHEMRLKSVKIGLVLREIPFKRGHLTNFS